MTNEIGEDFLYYGTAKEIWDVEKETYSNVDNTSTIFEIKSLHHDLRQGDSTVTEYFNNSPSRYWQQLDIYEEIDWACTDDSKQYEALVEKDRIFRFLLGLNKDLDEVRGRILGTKPLPKVREVFAEVRRKRAGGDNVGSTNSATHSEGSVLASRGPGSQPKKSRPWCEHCKKTSHTKDTCWFIHGKPADAKFPRSREAHGNAASSSM